MSCNARLDSNGNERMEYQERFPPDRVTILSRQFVITRTVAIGATLPLAGGSAKARSPPFAEFQSEALPNRA
jgi:hypothetical protein